MQGTWTLVTTHFKERVRNNFSMMITPCIGGEDMYESEQYMKFHTSTKKYMKGIRCVKAVFTIIIAIT